MRQAAEIPLDAPLLLRRLRKKTVLEQSTASAHMTVVTTQGQQTEMHDQQEDSTRYDQD